MQAPLIYRDRSAIILWLTVCALFVAAMVLVGGYTRLSGSGMSITQWKPLHGFIPPLSDTQWQEEFAGYQATPQYAQVNKGMTLDEFRGIFWPEFIHRVIARLVGVVFFLPLIAFALRRSFTKRFGLRLLGIFALGGLQGGIGWFMVASGLTDLPYVSHLRLALHLAAAFAIFALILWAIFDAKHEEIRAQSPVLGVYKLWFGALCLQIMLGAFVAGLHAGLIYNSFPLMNGQFLADGAFDMRPGYKNFFFNLTLIQFMHRWLAVAVAFGFIFWWRSVAAYVKNTPSGKYCAYVLSVIALQFTLGVITLLQQAPLPLALAHQMTALLLFALAVALMHSLTRLKPRNDV